MTETEKLIGRIEVVLAEPGDKSKYGPDDANVLDYCLTQLAHPERRPEDYQDLSHLRQAANERLKPYERKEH